MSRPPATAPRGRVTMAQAAELAGVSKSAVQRRVAAGTVPARTEPDGTITIARRDVHLIAPREPADTDRVAIMMRPVRARYAAWKRAAGNQPVSVWGGELMDQAAGWTSAIETRNTKGH
jgi:hypothetical protein